MIFATAISFPADSGGFVLAVVDDADADCETIWDNRSTLVAICSVRGLGLLRQGVRCRRFC